MQVRLKKSVFASVAVCAALSFGMTAQAAVLDSNTVFSNNFTPGDSVTNPGGPAVSEAIGSSNWYYTSVRQDAEIGITDANPRSGNGSVGFSSTSGTGKADITFGTGSVLGAFSNLVNMSYDWFRSSSSTNPPLQMPAMRVLLDADGDLSTSDGGGLVFEVAYNGGVVSTDTWVSSTIDSTTNLWSYGLGRPFAADGYNNDLAWWQTELPDAVILGFNVGIGSGWNGTFAGAADNIAWTIGKTTTTSNFEVAPVPLPAAAWFLLTGLGALGGLRWLRRREPEA